MFTSKKARVVAGLAVAALAAGAVGASSEVTNAGADERHPARVTFSTSMTSQERHLTTVGVNSERVFGSNLLTGTTTVCNQAATLQFLGTVNYVNGSGPWSGLITVTTASGSFGVSATGPATLSSVTSNTTFQGVAQVIGGSGAYTHAQGVGTATGLRQTSLGGAVDFTFNLAASGLGC